MLRRQTAPSAPPRSPASRSHKPAPSAARPGSRASPAQPAGADPAAALALSVVGVSAVRSQRPKSPQQRLPTKAGLSLSPADSAQPALSLTLQPQHTADALARRAAAEAAYAQGSAASARGSPAQGRRSLATRQQLSLTLPASRRPASAAAGSPLPGPASPGYAVSPSASITSSMALLRVEEQSDSEPLGLEGSSAEFHNNTHSHQSNTNLLLLGNKSSFNNNHSPSGTAPQPPSPGPRHRNNPDLLQLPAHGSHAHPRALSASSDASSMSVVSSTSSSASSSSASLQIPPAVAVAATSNSSSGTIATNTAATSASNPPPAAAPSTTVPSIVSAPLVTTTNTQPPVAGVLASSPGAYSGGLRPHRRASSSEPPSPLPPLDSPGLFPPSSATGGLAASSNNSSSGTLRPSSPSATRRSPSPRNAGRNNVFFSANGTAFGLTRTTLNETTSRLLQAIRAAVGALQLSVADARLEDVARLVDTLMSQPHRTYHTTEHVFDLFDDGAATPIAALAALLHDTVYILIDGPILPAPVHAALRGLGLAGPSRAVDDLRMPAQSAHTDPRVVMAALVFGHPFDAPLAAHGRNELLSALLASATFDFLPPHLLLSVVVHIEATIPFRPQGWTNQLRSRALQAAAAASVSLTEEEATRLVAQANFMAHRDVGNFGHADARYFLINTWRLFPENRPALRVGAAGSRLTDWAAATWGTVQFFGVLRPTSVFHEPWSGTQQPWLTAEELSEERRQWEQRVAYCQRNLAVGRLYVGAHVVVASALLALANLADESAAVLGEADLTCPVLAQSLMRLAPRPTTAPVSVGAMMGGRPTTRGSVAPRLSRIGSRASLVSTGPATTLAEPFAWQDPEADVFAYATAIMRFGRHAGPPTYPRSSRRGDFFEQRDDSPLALLAAQEAGSTEALEMAMTTAGAYIDGALPVADVLRRLPRLTVAASAACFVYKRTQRAQRLHDALAAIGLDIPLI